MLFFGGEIWEEGKERVWLSYEEAMVKMGEDGVVEGGLSAFLE
jgi:hypothetical protein